MNVLEFDSALVPSSQRLAAFRQAAADFTVDALGEASEFRARWRLLKLGDLNVLRSSVTPVHYRRDLAMIEADGQDRVAIHCYLRGECTGLLDGSAVQVGPGAATVWDLARTIDMRCDAGLETIIVTMPRYLMDDVFAVPSYACVVPASAALALAVDQAVHMLARPETIADQSAVHVGRAVRDLFALAVLPILQRSAGRDDDAGQSPYHRLCHVIDADLARDWTVAGCADLLASSPEAIRGVVEPVGGLDVLVERRRLLASYRMLSDVNETAPVSMIAWRCGFSDVARFNRRFRTTFGASPGEIRTRPKDFLPDWAGAYRVEASYRRFLAG